jgi:hypothetical protein
VEFVVGFKLDGKPGHVILDAEDALIAASKCRSSVRRRTLKLPPRAQPRLDLLPLAAAVYQLSLSAS